MSSTAMGPATDTEPLRIRYRIRFSKTDLLRWISHRDLARLWERILRRAKLQLSMTEGFHAKPRIGFPSALALGIQGIDEVVEIDLAEEISACDLLQRLSDDNQPGLRINSVGRVPEGCPKARLIRSHYSVPIPDGFNTDGIETAIAQMRQTETLSVQRKGKKLTIDTTAQIHQLAMDDAALIMVMSASESADLKPTDVLSAMGLESLLEAGAFIVRTRVELELELDSKLINTHGPEHCVQQGMKHEERNAYQRSPTGRESHCDS